MKYILLFTLFASQFCYSQDCTRELLQSKPGTWKANQQGQIINVSAADLAKEKAVVANLHKLVTSNYKPTGCQVAYSTVYGKALNAGLSWIADPYQYHLYILRYLCEPNSPDKSKYYVDISTTTTVSVTANVIFPLHNLYAAELPDDEPRGYLKLRHRPQWKNGYYFMGEEVVGDSHLKNKIKEYRWLVTYSDTLPFVYVNRKEYLLIQKKRLEQNIQESPSDKAWLETFIKNINEYLKKPESELNQPAICAWNEEHRFEKFVPEGTANSFFAVKPNLAYYRKKLPMSAPQFFSVVYRISHGDPVFEENIGNIQKALDLTTLKGMLGK